MSNTTDAPTANGYLSFGDTTRHLMRRRDDAKVLQVTCD